MSGEKGNSFSGEESRGEPKFDGIPDLKLGGASVGDGIKYSVKVGAIVGMATMLLQNGPFLLIVVGGLFSLFRFAGGSGDPPAMRPPQYQTASASQGTRRRSPPQRTPAYFDNTPAPVVHVQPPLRTTASVNQPVVQVEPGTSPTIGLVPARQPLAEMLIDPEPTIFEVPETPSPLFNFRQGQTLIGTSQMPGQPSRRVSMSILAIRDGGRNVTANLKTLDSPRVSKNFTGCIEYDPLRLTLRTVRDPRSIHMFLPGTPWYSRSPTKITLDLEGFAKTILGRSSSGEEFELLPKERDRLPAEPPPATVFVGFTDDSHPTSRWQMTRRNHKVIDDDSRVYWMFSAEDDGAGRFVWMKNGKRHAGGKFSEQSTSGELDIRMGSDGGKLYRGLVMPLGSSTDRVRVCIPKKPGSDRPKKTLTEYGNVFDLVRVRSEDSNG